MGAVILASDEGQFGIQVSVEAWRAGQDLLSVLEAGTKAVEDDRRAYTVGFGGAPNVLGEMQLDASIMEGTTLCCGAVGALSGVRHPISVARKVMEVLPHVFLTGDGARRFACEMELEEREMLSDEAQERYDAWLKKNNLTEHQISQGRLSELISFARRKDLSKGTVTFLMRDAAGRLAGTVSTSGWAYKYPGRLGDSPVIGAGMYVDDRYGAASCTHTGEMTIRCATAHAVVMHLRYGCSLKEACHEAMRDLQRLKGGYLGPVLLGALSPEGETYLLQLGETDGSSYWQWREDTGEVSAVKPDIFQ